jgi:hypothetical protein
MGTPVMTIFQLLLGAGVVEAATITMFDVRPTQRLLRARRALLGSNQ